MYVPEPTNIQLRRRTVEECIMNRKHQFGLHPVKMTSLVSIEIWVTQPSGDFRKQRIQSQDQRHLVLTAWVWSHHDSPSSYPWHFCLSIQKKQWIPVSC
uniref:Uncharacterized protein n=1 Tax=Sphaerodactylus townsendi TaxID=933632 RepID=A0ACB8GB07_9SAUR